MSLAKYRRSHYYLLPMDIDGYDNYSGDEEFNEDSLTNEEYDALYELLPQLKKLLELFNPDIDELSLKEALYYNYFELEPALKEIQSKFPKKKGMLFCSSDFLLSLYPRFALVYRDRLSSRMLIFKKLQPPSYQNLLC